MINLRDLTTSQLRSIIAIKEQIKALQGQINSIVAGGGGKIPIPSAGNAAAAAKHKLSAAHRRKLAKALAKAREMRWAKITGETASDSKPAKKKDRRSSRAGNSGRETEIRETGRGLVEHLDEIGRLEGHAQLIQYVMNLRIHYRDVSRGRGEAGASGLKSEIHSIPTRCRIGWNSPGNNSRPLERRFTIFADRHRGKGVAPARAPGQSHRSGELHLMSWSPQARCCLFICGAGF